MNDDEHEIPVPPRERGNTPKWEVYEKILKVPYYVVYSRYNKKIWFFKLINGCYQLQALDSQNPLIKIEEIKLSLGLWTGTHGNMKMTWLRWYDWEVTLIPTGEEKAIIAKQEAELAKQRAESAKQEAELAKSKLTQTVLNLAKHGMSQTDIANITELTEEIVAATINSHS